MANSDWDILREQNLARRYRFSVGSLVVGFSVLILVALTSLAYVYPFLGLGLHAALVASLGFSPFLSIAVLLGVMALLAVTLGIRNLVRINSLLNEHRSNESDFMRVDLGKKPSVANVTIPGVAALTSAKARSGGGQFTLAASGGSSSSVLVDEDAIKQDRFLEILNTGTEAEALEFIDSEENYAFKPMKADKYGYTALFLAKLKRFTELERRLSNSPYIHTSAYVYREPLSAGKMRPIKHDPWSTEEGLKVIQGIIERNDLLAFEVVLAIAKHSSIIKWPSNSEIKNHKMSVNSFLAKMERLKMFQGLVEKSSGDEVNTGSCSRDTLPLIIGSFHDTTPLIEAARAGHADLARFLLAHHANIHFENSDKETADSVAVNDDIKTILREHAAAMASRSLYKPS